MASIPSSQIRKRFTQDFVAAYKERVQVKSFLRSFTTVREYATRYLEINIQRSGELIAVDVPRGHEGNMNTFDKNTQKIFDVPYYREFFNLTDIDLYEQAWLASDVNAGIYDQFVENVVDRIMMLVDKIERSKELQVAQAIQTGIVTMASGENINFQRKAASMVDLGTGDYWNGSDVNPIDALEAAGEFLRAVGKAEGGSINAIFGARAWRTMINNPKFQALADVRNFKLMDVGPQQRNAVGGVLKGRIEAGSYDIIAWTYPEFYDTASQTNVRYIDQDNVCFLPEGNTSMILAHAAVPQLLSETNPLPTKGQYVFGKYIDEDKTIDKRDVKSAALVIPVKIDQIYTLKASAASGS